MKIKYLIASMLLSASLLTGCDFVRASLGRPTSADIEAKRLAIEVEQRAAEELRASETLEVPEELEAAPDTIATGLIMVRRSDLKASIVSGIPSRYCIVAGAFSNPANAENLATGLEGRGYDVCLLKYGSGLTAVAVSPTGDIRVLQKKYLQLTGDGLIPADAWVLVNE